MTYLCFHLLVSHEHKTGVYLLQTDQGTVSDEMTEGHCLYIFLNTLREKKGLSFEIKVPMVHKMSF